MEGSIRKHSHAVRRAASVLAVAAVVAAATGIVAGRGNASPPAKPDKGSSRVDEPRFKEPKLKHGALKIRGTNDSDTVALRLQAGQPGVLEIDVGDDGSADFSFDRASVAAIELDARDGDDIVRIDESQGAFTDAIPTTIDGGDGNDTIDGNGGNDVALMGDDDDTFIWDPGDGSDKLEGEDGTDVMVFNGAGGPEQVDLSANGNRLRFFRTQATITMDTAGIEGVDFNALGGADTVTVNDLTGTDVTDVHVDLAAALGGVTGDGVIDHVVVNGTNGPDAIAVGGNADGVTVSGLHALVTLLHQEPTDKLDVNGLAGDDSVDATALAAGALSLTIDGAAGNDTINGGNGAETLSGGDGNDTIDGNGGADTGLMGAGNDIFVWDPGDGSDVVEGQDGPERDADTLLFNGAGAAENFDVSANGGRVRFSRAQGGITMDLNDVEFIDVRALGGADTAVLNDTTGTDLKRVSLDLEGAIGSGAGDGAADSVTVNGTNNSDDIEAIADAGSVDVIGAPVNVEIDHPELANDKLTVNGLGGDDDIVIDREVADLIQTLVDLGGGE